MNDKKVTWPGWETIRILGRGSFGAVYEIQRDVFGKQEKAALKVISIPQSRGDIEELYADGYNDKSITERFRGYLKDIVQEYSLMAEMKGHTNIVYCDDLRYVQHDDGFGWDIFIKMELLTPLTKALGKSSSDRQVMKIGMDMCNALILCKSRNIVHRDIKPQNIFVSDDGNYKLGDFGIAKTAERTTSGTKTGTYKYMAPEVYNNQPYGQTADIYSLGLVLYWLMNERRTPFLPLPPRVPTAAEEDQARSHRFAGEAIPAPAHGNRELKRIVLKACAFEPKDRYASAEEMRADLEALSLGRPNGLKLVNEDATVIGDMTNVDKTVIARKQNPENSNMKSGMLSESNSPSKERKKWHVLVALTIIAIVMMVISTGMLVTSIADRHAKKGNTEIKDLPQLSSTEIPQSSEVYELTRPTETEPQTYPTEESKLAIAIPPTTEVQIQSTEQNALDTDDGDIAEPDSRSNEPQLGSVLRSAVEIRVRSGPGTSYAEAGRLKGGNLVKVYEQQLGSDGRNWGKIDDGWVCMDYIVFNEDTSVAPDLTDSENRGQLGSVLQSAMEIKVRSGPGTSYAEKGRLKGGTLVKIHEQQKDSGGRYWGRTDDGWVCMDYIVLGE